MPSAPTLPGFGVRQYPPDFLEWWAEYPRRQSKKDALTAWHQTRHSRPPRRVLLRITRVHTLNWKAEGTNPRHVPLPATWLRGERWDDELQRQVQVGVTPQFKPIFGVETWTPDYIYEEEGADA